MDKSKLERLLNDGHINRRSYEYIGGLVDKAKEAQSQLADAVREGQEAIAECPPSPEQLFALCFNTMAAQSRALEARFTLHLGLLQAVLGHRDNEAAREYRKSVGLEFLDEPLPPS